MNSEWTALKMVILIDRVEKGVDGGCLLHEVFCPLFVSPEGRFSIKLCFSWSSRRVVA
jgi:hypothetical protein